MFYHFPLSDYYLSLNCSTKETKNKSYNRELFRKIYKTERRKGKECSKKTRRENVPPSKNGKSNGKND